MTSWNIAHKLLSIMSLPLLLLALLTAMPLYGEEQQVHLAVAANFAQPLKTIAREFEKETGIRPVLTVASSGILYAQITHGASFDVFLSADAARPQKLIDAGLARPEQVLTYALGRLAYIDRTQTKPTLDSIKTFALAPTTRLAIADPDLAPYGMAAKETLATIAMWQQLLPAIVYGKSILQTYQYYQTGNVDRALVAWSLVKDDNEHVVLIPGTYHRPIIQKLAILNEGRHPTAARLFVDYLLSPEVQERLTSWGYQSHLQEVTGAE